MIFASAYFRNTTGDARVRPERPDFYPENAEDTRPTRHPERCLFQIVEHNFSQSERQVRHDVASFDHFEHGQIRNRRQRMRKQR